jgi:hypothetical protein
MLNTASESRLNLLEVLVQLRIDLCDPFDNLADCLFPVLGHRRLDGG